MTQRRAERTGAAFSHIFRWAAGLLACAAAFTLALSGRIVAGASGYPLVYQFSAMPLPVPVSGLTTTSGRVGGLPAKLALTPGGCPAGSECGTFVVTLAGFSPAASAKMGELSGTYTCAAGECALALARNTGVFAKAVGPALSVHPGQPATGMLGTRFDSLGEWVAVVARAATALKAEGMLPAGMTVSDLVAQAATNGKVGDEKSGGVQQSPPAVTSGSTTQSGSGGGKSGGGGSGSDKGGGDHEHGGGDHGKGGH